MYPLTGVDHDASTHTLGTPPRTVNRLLADLDLKVPSVYGPTADTDGKVLYSFEQK